jgi:sortase (surface protein transpeptidase)
LIAGHVGGPGGSSAVFAHLDRLRPGDPIVVRDTRTAVDVRFSVTEARTYLLDHRLVVYAARIA